MTEASAIELPPTLPALLAWRAAASPTAPAQWRLTDDGQWQSNDWQRLQQDITRATAALRHRGLTAGDRLGIMAPTCAQWDVAQLAALSLGVVVVGIDIHEHDERLAQILALCDLTALIVADVAMLARVPQTAQARLRFAVALQADAAAALMAWDAFVQAAGGADPAPRTQPQPDDPALIVFTSGTTGAPKGIAYSHRQVTQACTAILEAFPDIGAGGRLACWLPLSNLFQRMLNFCAIARGAEIYYVDNPRDIMRHLPRIAPQVFIAVPRFYEKFYSGVLERIQTKPAWQRRLFRSALALARRNLSQPSWLLRPLSALLDALALRPVRAALGKQIRFLISGSAPMPKWLLTDFAALGLPVFEAYGMSENIIPNCINRPGAVKLGSVGQPLRGNEIRIADDGELLVRGPGVFSGYWGEAPAQRTPDGFLPSGDYAEQDAQGFITLTGRKSEIFKTSTGRRIAPAGIEALVKQIPGVEQCMVFGANRPFLIALLWIEATRLEQLRPDIQREAAVAVAGLPDYQQPAGLLLIPRALSLARGEITANLKLRRQQVAQNYAADIERLYDQLQRKPGEAVITAMS